MRREAEGRRGEKAGRSGGGGVEKERRWEASGGELRWREKPGHARRGEVKRGEGS